MGSVGIVVEPPGFELSAGILDRKEQPGVEALVAEPPYQRHSEESQLPAYGSGED